jgi:hypothetical protein
MSLLVHTPIQPMDVVAWQDWALAEDPAYPLLSAADAEGDPMAPLLGALTPLTGVRYAGLQLIMAPLPSQRWQWWAKLRATVLEHEAQVWNKPQLKLGAAAIRAKAAQAGVSVVLRAVVIAESSELARRQLAAMGGLLTTLRQQRGDVVQGWASTVSGLAPLTSTLAHTLAERPGPVQQLALTPPPTPFSSLVQQPAVLVPTELAAHWHVPSPRLLTTAHWRDNRYLPPPPELILGPVDGPPPAFDELTPMAQRTIRLMRGRRPDGQPVHVGIPFGSLMTHMQIVSPTGSGKSHTIINMVSEFHRIGAGYAVVDFKGDTIDLILQRIPRARWPDVCIIDPTDKAFPVSLNLLDRQMLPPSVEVDFLGSLIESTLAQIDENWKSSVGMQQFIGWGAKALLEGEPNATLVHLNTFFLSEVYRAQVLAGVTDVQTRLWWEQVFPTLPDQQKLSLVALQRRLDQFLMNSTVRRICNQPRTSVDFRNIMDNRGILLVKLPVELIGEKEGGFLATLILNMIVAAAFTRQALPEAEREAWALIIDEVQVAIRRADPRVLETTIERLRSFGIGLVAAHQYLGQLGKDGLKETVQGTVLSFLVLGAQGDDAATWAKQFANAGVVAQDFLGIPTREEGYLKTIVQGRPLKLCSIETLAAWPMPSEDVEPRADTTSSTEAADRVVLTPADQRMDERIAALARMTPEDALTVLYRAPEQLWQAYLARTAAQRRVERQALLDQPGRISDLRARLVTLSRLAWTRPALEVSAEALRLLAAFRGPTAAAKGATTPPRRGGQMGQQGGPASDRLTARSWAGGVLDPDLVVPLPVTTDFEFMPEVLASDLNDGEEL